MLSSLLPQTGKNTVRGRPPRRYDAEFFGGVRDQYDILCNRGYSGSHSGVFSRWAVWIPAEKGHREREIGSAEEEATRIVNDAYKSAESKKREALVEAKEEILKARNEYEQEEKERRADLQKQERRLQQKEENLDRKTENMEKKEEHLANRLAKLEATQAEAERIKQEQVDTLERISGFTAEEAKTYLLDQLELT